MTLDLRVDFVDQRRWPPAGLALAALALLALLWQGQLAWHDAQHLAQQRARLAQVQRQAVAPRPAAPNPALLRRQQQIEAVAAYLATPWGALLGVFETHASAQVVLLRFAPDAGAGRVELGGRATDVAAMAAYLVALERDPRLQDVMLRHHEVAADTASAVDFVLSATWPGAMERAAANTPVPAAASPRTAPPQVPRS
jgi:Tfp pilus assembly protein PilN